MTYTLSKKSLSALRGVEPDLVAVVKRAIEITGQDFIVYEGLRSAARQAEYKARGVSWTMNSKHLKQADGFGHAVDLVPWIDRTARWEWPGCYVIAAAVKDAAEELGVAIRWGGVWDRRLSVLSPGAEGMRAEVAAYCARHPGVDRIDGPHFELA